MTLILTEFVMKIIALSLFLDIKPTCKFISTLFLQILQRLLSSPGRKHGTFSHRQWTELFYTLRVCVYVCHNSVKCIVLFN